MESTSIDRRTVFFFDIDNCLYSKNANVHGLMSDLIDQYFQTHLSLSAEDANMLHFRYYRDYGLAIEGLVRHHKVDPVEYNRLVDDALPLDQVLKPNPALRKLLLDLDTTKVKPWLLTNAYITHARRVLKLLDLEDCFEGVTFCDYAKMPFVCKPSREMYEKAEREANVPADKRGSGGVYFVDDSHLNCTHAQQYGWTTVHLLEPNTSNTDSPPPALTSKHRIASLLELRGLFPEFFKSVVSAE